MILALPDVAETIYRAAANAKDKTGLIILAAGLAAAAIMHQHAIGEIIVMRFDGEIVGESNVGRRNDFLNGDNLSIFIKKRITDPPVFGFNLLPSILPEMMVSRPSNMPSAPQSKACCRERRPCRQE